MWHTIQQIYIPISTQRIRKQNACLEPSWSSEFNMFICLCAADSCEAMMQLDALHFLVVRPIPANATSPLSTPWKNSVKFVTNFHMDLNGSLWPHKTGICHNRNEYAKYDKMKHLSVSNSVRLFGQIHLWHHSLNLHTNRDMSLAQHTLIGCANWASS